MKNSLKHFKNIGIFCFAFFLMLIVIYSSMLSYLKSSVVVLESEYSIESQFILIKLIVISVWLILLVVFWSIFNGIIDNIKLKNPFKEFKLMNKALKKEKQDNKNKIKDLIKESIREVAREEEWK